MAGQPLCPPTCCFSRQGYACVTEDVGAVTPFASFSPNYPVPGSNGFSATSKDSVRGLLVALLPAKTYLKAPAAAALSQLLLPGSCYSLPQLLIRTDTPFLDPHTLPLQVQLLLISECTTCPHSLPGYSSPLPPSYSQRGPLPPCLQCC